MKRSLVVCLLLAVGCSDQTAPAVANSPGPGVGVGGGSGGTPAIDAGTDAAVDGGEPKGDCDNETDLNAIDGAGSSMRDLARDCGSLECGIFFGNGFAYESCIDSCITAQVPDLSTSCTACYGRSERCSHDSLCSLRCRNDTCSTMCLSCMNLADCVPELEECTGILGDDCQG